jgi:hypothetical protein
MLFYAFKMAVAILRNLNCFNSLFAKKRNRRSHFKYIKKHKIIPKLRSCYRVSITSNQAAKNFFIRSKNNNKMGLMSLSNLAIYIKKAEFSGFKA